MKAHNLYVGPDNPPAELAGNAVWIDTGNPPAAPKVKTCVDGQWYDETGKVLDLHPAPAPPAKPGPKGKPGKD